MKKALFLFLILAAVAVLVFLFLGKGKTSEVKFITAEVQRGDISIIVTATGSLEAVTTVQVGSQVSGTIAALYVDFNDHVKKGQVIAQLDSAFLKAQVVQALADLDKAVASANLAKKNYDRSASLYEANLISESDKENVLTAYELAQAELKSSRANLDRLKTNLDYATIISPIDGVVISRDVDVGQTVAASLSAPTIFTIAQDLTKMQVKASIDEADIGKIADGQEASFTVDAYPEQTFKGTVRQIRLSPEIVQNVVSYSVILDVSNLNMLLKPGMTANVTILIDQRENVLEVPATALRFRPSGLQKESLAASEDSSKQSAGGAYAQGGARLKPDSLRIRKSGGTVLWILNQEGKPERIQVETGISNGTFTEIISDNLKEGEKVITGQEGGQTSSNNQQVNPFAPRFGGGRR